MNREQLIRDLAERANRNNLYFNIIGTDPKQEGQAAIITYFEPLSQFREAFGGQINPIPSGPDKGLPQWKLFDEPAYIITKELLYYLNRGTLEAKRKLPYAWKLINWWEARHASDS